VTPAPPDLYASFAGQPDRRVLGFDDQGRALVLDRDRLAVAEQLAGFGGLELIDERAECVVPGGGWIAVFRDADRQVARTPIVAWLVTQDRLAVPLVCDPWDSVAVAVRDFGTDNDLKLTFVRLEHEGDELNDLWNRTEAA
jgi:hypothetical protein